MKSINELRTPEEDASVDITPMLDIVFIMLIFFIVTTAFVKESGTNVNRPEAKTAIAAKKGNIMIAVKENGDIWVDRRKVKLNQLRSRVEELRVENPEGEVVVTADLKSKTGVMVQVVDQVRAAGINKPFIATLKDE